MAIDGTPPFKLPPGAQPIVLNDFDLLSATQSATATGPYTVPAGKRLIITGALISWVESSATPPTNGREVLLQVTSLEGDGHPLSGGQAHTFHGVAVPPTPGGTTPGPGGMVTASVTDLALPVPAGAVVLVAITSGAGIVTASTAQVLVVWGWLETTRG